MAAAGLLGPDLVHINIAIGLKNIRSEILLLQKRKVECGIASMKQCAA